MIFSHPDGTLQGDHLLYIMTITLLIIVQEIAVLLDKEEKGVLHLEVEGTVVLLLIEVVAHLIGDVPLHHIEENEEIAENGNGEDESHQTEESQDVFTLCPDQIILQVGHMIVTW